MDAVIDTLKRLQELHRERALAQMTPLAGQTAYMADLDSEIAVTQAAYVAVAVIEIATLRAHLGERNLG
jgi:hypothetical protein